MNVSTAAVWAWFGLIYAIYYVITFDSPGLVDAIRKKLGHDRGELVRIAGSRLFIFVFLGLIPWILMPRLFGESNARWGVTLLPTGKDFIYGAGVSLIAVSLILYNPRKQGFTKKYPQMRIRKWGGMEISVNMVTWVLYLAAYETMFRGYLLFSMDSLGMFAAIAIMETLYIIIHLPFGGLVTWGTIPFGLAVGFLSWREGSFWIAFLAHIAVAFTHTTQSAILNPEMEFPVSIKHS